MPARLLIFKLFSRQHALILHSVFIHSNIFDQKYQKLMFFRLLYAHFWALILVTIKFSRRHVYYFQNLFQRAHLFRQVCLFRTLEYPTTYHGNKSWRSLINSIVLQLPLCATNVPLTHHSCIILVS